MSDPKFFKEWREDTAIDWWNEGRAKLNAVIREYNAWARMVMVDPVGARHGLLGKYALALIEEGRQTWASVEGGGGWLEVLDEMKAEIERVLNVHAE